MKRRGFVVSFEALTALLLVFAVLAIMYAAIRDAPRAPDTGSEFQAMALAKDIAMLSAISYGKNASLGNLDQERSMLYRMPPGMCGRVYLIDNSSGGYFDSASRGDCMMPSEGKNTPVPVAYWTFDAEQVRGSNASNSTYTLDAGAIGFDCLLGNGMQSQIPSRKEREDCRRGSCYSFNGSQMLTCGNDTRLDFGGGGFSLTGWLFAASLVSSQGYVVSKYYSGLGSASNGLYMNGTRLQYSTKTPGAAEIASSITAQAWHHFAIVTRGTNTSLYLDGEYKNSSNTTFASSANLSQLALGGDVNNPANGFNGTLDEFKLFDRALTVDEVRQEAAYKVFGRYSFDYDMRAPVAHANAMDESGNWNDLRVRGNATQVASERGGMAFSFPGVLGGSALENTTVANFTQATVMMWVKQRSYGSASNQPGLAGRSGSFALYSNSSSNGGLVLLVWNTTGAVRLPSLVQAPLNEWHHVAFTYAGKNGTMYLDGVGVNLSNSLSCPQCPFNLTVNSITGPLLIGTTSYGTHDFNGTMDDLRIYGRALTAAEIKSAYEGYVERPVQFESAGLFGATYSKIGGLLGSANKTTAFFGFDYNATGNVTNDSSPNALHALVGNGTAAQMPVLNRSNDSPVGNSLLRAQNLSGYYDFDGLNDVIVGRNNNPSAYNPPNITVEAWVRTANLSSPSTQIAVSYFNLSASKGWELQLASGGKPVFKRGDGSNTIILTGPDSLNLGVWSYIAATHSSSDGTRLYVNGALAAQNSSDLAAAQNPAAILNFTMGGDSPGCAGCYFNGSIDEVRVYSKSLSAKQVHERYMLRAGYPFDANMSTVGGWVNDSSIYKSHCTLVNGTWNNTGGISGGFYDFNATANSNTSINCGNSSSMSVVSLGNRTVMMWFRIRDATVSSDDYGYVLFSRGPDLGQPDVMAVNGTRNRIFYSFYNGSSVINVVGDSAPLFGEIPKGRWLHAAVSYNNLTKETRLYLNGVMLAKSVNRSAFPPDGDFLLGRDPAGQHLMNGSIDEVRVFGRALSDYEIYDEYMASASPNERFAVRGVAWGR